MDIPSCSKNPNDNERESATYRALSIFSKVSAACSKKLRTRGALKSRSASLSSISRIWEKIVSST